MRATHIAGCVCDFFHRRSVPLHADTEGVTPPYGPGVWRAEERSGRSMECRHDGWSFVSPVG